MFHHFMQVCNENEDHYCRGVVDRHGSPDGVGEGCAGKGGETLFRLCGRWRVHSRAGLLRHDPVFERAILFVSRGREKEVETPNSRGLRGLTDRRDVGRAGTLLLSPDFEMFVE